VSRVYARNSIQFSPLVLNSPWAVPQGLKPAFLAVVSGTAEAVPYPEPFMRPVLVRPWIQEALDAFGFARNDL
jgi:hypothetical protein